MDPLRRLGRAAVCILAACTFFACAGGGEDPSGNEQMLALETEAHMLEQSLLALADENAVLRDELAILREQSDHVERQEGAELPESTRKRSQDSGRNRRSN